MNKKQNNWEKEFDKKFPKQKRADLIRKGEYTNLIKQFISKLFKEQNQDLLNKLENMKVKEGRVGGSILMDRGRNEVLEEIIKQLKNYEN